MFQNARIVWNRIRVLQFLQELLVQEGRFSTPILQKLGRNDEAKLCFNKIEMIEEGDEFAPGCPIPDDHNISGIDERAPE